MKKRLLTIMIAFAVLTGCNGTVKETDPSVTQALQVTQGDAANQTNSLPPVNDGLTGQNNKKEYVQPKMEGEITISTLLDHEFLTIAADMFMNKYPNVKIKVNAFLNSSNNLSNENPMENYRSQLNTKIMTGKAEDIILAGHLPIKKYTDMGAFEDMANYLNQTPEINTDNYFTNVIQAMKNTEGKLYVMPLASSLEIVSFDKQLVTESNKQLDDNITVMSYEKALDFAKQLVDTTSRENTYLVHGDGLDIVNGLLKDSYKKYIDVDNKKANIDTTQYIALLQTAKDLAEQGYFAASGSIDFYNMEFHFALKSDFEVQAAYYSLVPDSNDYHSIPLSDTDGNVYVNPNLSIGINSSSNNKELSWEFIKFLLSDEVQTMPSLYTWLGINKKGFDAAVDRNLKLFNEGNKETVSKDDYKNLLESWIMQINAYDPYDPTIDEFLLDEQSKFLGGKQSAEETARVLQAKIDKYFNE